VTDATVLAFYDWLFAPWVKDLGLRDFSLSPAVAAATLPHNQRLEFASGAVCGQVIMAAIDTVAAIAMSTTDRHPKGTVYQHTHFLRPAVRNDLRIETRILRFGKTSAYADSRVFPIACPNDLIAHASLEFAF
jgi:acyl-coenzyme A thioesterase PaaI-like protein